MTHQTLECGQAPAITMEIHGDARIEGWDKNEIHAECDSDELALAQDGEAIRLICQEDCEVKLPRGAAVNVTAIHGDARIRDITGSLSIGGVGGDCSIKRVGMLDAQNVGGDAELSCEQFGGASLNVGGDTRLSVKSGLAQSFAVKSGGDITCKLPLGINARVSITDSAGSRAFSAGDGSLAVSLTCGGEARLAGAGAPREERNTEFSFDFGKNFGSTFGDQISKRINDQLEARMKEKAERMAEKAMRHSQRATRRAEEHTGRMEQKMQNKAFVLFGQRFPFGKPARAPQAPAAPEAGTGATDAESMAILRMLADKKITAEQAEQLLSALA